jgi:hypothetical protein
MPPPPVLDIPPPQAVPVPTPAAAPMPATGTFVGAKVVNLRNELESLKGIISGQSAQYQQHLNNTSSGSQRYHSNIAAINARLQVGTTPGNPALVGQWQAAQADLDAVAFETSGMTELSNRISGDLALGNYLGESARAAYGVQGAIDEDHRQLAVLEDDINRTRVSIERLLNEVNDTIRRQNNYIGSERRNLTTLSLAIANGEAFGPSLSTLAAQATPTVPAGGGTANDNNGRPPLVVIRFDRPDVEFQQALYGAISKTLEVRPAAGFDLIAVTPNRGSPSEVAARSGDARRGAERVLRSMMAMGLPMDRVNVSSATSNLAQGNEVHVYIR